jgi:hypothetical protein
MHVVVYNASDLNGEYMNLAIKIKEAIGDRQLIQIREVKDKILLEETFDRYLFLDTNTLEILRIFQTRKLTPKSYIVWYLRSETMFDDKMEDALSRLVFHLCNKVLVPNNAFANALIQVYKLNKDDCEKLEVVPSYIDFDSIKSFETTDKSRVFVLGGLNNLRREEIDFLLDVIKISSMRTNTKFYVQDGNLPNIVDALKVCLTKEELFDMDVSPTPSGEHPFTLCVGGSIFNNEELPKQILKGSHPVVPNIGCYPEIVRRDRYMYRYLNLDSCIECLENAYKNHSPPKIYIEEAHKGILREITNCFIEEV